MWWLHSLFEDPQRSRTAGHSSTVLAFLRSPSALAFCRRPGAESPSRLSPHRGSTRRPSRPSRAACRPSRAACRPSRADVWSQRPTRRFSRGDWDRDCGATGAFSKRRLGFTHGRLGPHWGRLAEPTLGARGGNSPGRLHGPAPGKKAPRGGEGDDSQARVACGPGPTRRSEWELATTVRAATSCAAPSYHPTFPYKP
jgi:hypothetical protein